jgi:uncharacterized membrane protein YfcA
MDLTPVTVIVLLFAFAWAGFVRAGLGFGGLALAYPILLLVVDSPIIVIPIMGIQLLFFSALMLYQNHHRIEWRTTLKLLLIMLPTFLLGVFGLITLPDRWLLFFVYGIVILYAINYIFPLRLYTPNRWLDGGVLILAGYVSGISLAGAPMIVAVASKYANRETLRETLLTLWFVMVSIKLGTMHAFGVDLQWIHQLWLLPAAAIGHVLGLKFHRRVQAMRNAEFYRLLGIILLAVSLAGVWRII